jgi:uncharacterized protein YciU (UPF0263 family)
MKACKKAETLGAFRLETHAGPGVLLLFAAFSFERRGCRAIIDAAGEWSRAISGYV